MKTATRSPAWSLATPRARSLYVLALVLALVIAPTLLALGSHDARTGTASTTTTTGLSTAWERPITFIETGLPAGTAWSVDLSGSTQSSSTTEIVFSELPGTYDFTVLPVAGYVASPESGEVVQNSCMATVYITFTPVTAVSSYNVWFNESGLPSGTSWWVDFNGTNVSSTSASIAFTAQNGTYLFTDPALILGGVGTDFVTSTNNGTVTVAGANVSVPIPYSAQYYLTTAVTPSAGGTVSPSSGWYAAGASVSLSEAANATYDFVGWNGTGNVNYTGTNSTPTVTMDSPVTEIAVFGVAYEVSFQETGLLDGVTWSVTFNGVTQSAYFVFLDFSAANGTYAYTVAPIPGYHTPSYSGNVTVAGSDVNVVIPWVRLTYNVSFVEAGLPSGTSWSVTLNGSSMSTLSSTLIFPEANGTYPWSVAAVAGYTANVTAGTVVVNGSAILIEIGWAASAPVPVGYTVTFVETGLPTSTTWSVSLNSSSASTPVQGATAALVLTGVPDGSYGYWVPAVGSYDPGPSGGSLTVAGANVTVNVAFTAHSTPPSPTPSGSAGLSLLDLLVFAVVGGGVATTVYFVHRLSGRNRGSAA